MSTRLEAAQRDSASHKRQLSEVNGLLETERKSVLELQAQLRQAQASAEVCSHALL